MRRFVLILSIVAGLAVASARGADAPDFAPKLASAATEVGYLNFERAIVLYREILESAPAKSEAWQEATFGLALTVGQLSPITNENTDQARSLYHQLIDAVPSSKFSPRAMMNLGRIDELSDYHDDKIDIEAARGWYRRVVENWPKDPIAGEATLRLAATYIRSYDPGQDNAGIDMLENWLASHPNEELASVMWQYIAETYFFPLKDYKKSLEAYDKVDALGWTDEGNQGRVYWRIAVMCDKYLHDRAAAIRYYTKIITETPTTGKAYEAQLALKKLGAAVPEIEIFQSSSTTAPATQTAEAPR